jgi:hypothetical protein
MSKVTISLPSYLSRPATDLLVDAVDGILDDLGIHAGIFEVSMPEEGKRPEDDGEAEYLSWEVLPIEVNAHAAIVAGFGRYGYARGTKECIAFFRGATWQAGECQCRHGLRVCPLHGIPEQRWAVFCRECGTEWSVGYPHTGRSLCDNCAVKKVGK